MPLLYIKYIKKKKERLVQVRSALKGAASR